LVFIIVFLHVVVVVADVQLLIFWSHKIDLQALFYLKYPQEIAHNLSDSQWLVLLLFILFTTTALYLLIWRILQKKIDEVSAISAKNLFIIIPILFLCIRGGLGLMPVLISDASYSDNQKKNALATNSMWNLFYQITEAGGIQEVDHFLNTNFPVDAVCQHYLVDQNDEFTPYYWDIRPNVVLVVLEGFSAELSSFFEGHDGSAMPYLDSLAGDGYAFTHTYASGDRTDKGLLSILSGWPGQTWQNMINHPSKLDKLPGLATNFVKKRGYKTSFYYGGDLDFANMQFYLKMNGFQELFGKKELEKMGGIKGKWGYHDESLLDFVASQLVKEEEPYFATVLTLSTHEPYELAPTYCKTIKEKMAFCMKYTDNAIRKFVQKMKKTKNYSNTLFVFTADHGKELNTINTSRTHRNFFHIPLFFYGDCLPNSFKHKVNSIVVSQADIYQSIHHLVLQSIDNRAKYSRSFFAKKHGHPGNALCNLTGTTVYIDSLSCNYMQTDKMSIKKKIKWNHADSLMFGMQSKIISDFFK
jgi:phosphoglycerol transferase MdoB-like AlkP superfamily enzyme